MTTFNLFLLTFELLKDADIDQDDLPDYWEFEYFGNLNESNSGDYDDDGLSNTEEYLLNTCPVAFDTDKDGISDYDEINSYQTNAINPDTDGDGVIDGEDDFPLNNKVWKKEKKISEQNNILIIAFLLIIIILLIIIVLFFIFKLKLFTKQSEKSLEQKNEIDIKSQLQKSNLNSKVMQIQRPEQQPSERDQFNYYHLINNKIKPKT